ncbi:MAG: S49 family peptidase [Opitutia bacterium]|jgi:signal peptide peptidase SppA
MKSLSQALAAGTPMLIDPLVAKGHVERVSHFVDKFDPKAADFDKILAMVFGEQPKYEVHEGVAYIPMKGVIGKGLTALEKATGGCDLDDVTEWMRQAAADPDVKLAVLDVDSPGGSVNGTPEAAAMFKALGKMKPTLAFCDGQACSAAYWVASQANRFSVTPSASIGNVGCFVAVTNVKKALAEAGVEVTVIKSGKYKAMGYPGTDLTEEQIKHLQEDIDSVGSDFRSDVKAVRTFVKDEDLEAQTFTGKEAAKRHLVTGLFYSYEDAVSKALS